MKPVGGMDVLAQLEYTKLSMKIYFAGSIRGGRDDAGLYGELISLLQSYGTVLTEHVGDKQLSVHGEGKAAEGIFQRDVDWVRAADVIVAEVTTPSLGVGYEIGLAESLGKKIICCYRPQPDRKLSAMVLGNATLTIVEYKTVDELKEKLTELL